MSSPALSVLIPTYNRKEILSKTLDAYARQTAIQDILEVLVVDDGSTDGTDELVRRSIEESPLSIRHLRQENRGLSAARNHGVREARGELILFADDDIIPAPGMVAEHVGWHRKHPQEFTAILGHVAWPPELNPTPFMQWLIKAMMLPYGRISHGQELDFRYFIGCNISLKVDFLRRNGLFDESFRKYGFEDMELGFRLEKRGLSILYNAHAVGYHYKRLSFADACRWWRSQEASRAVLEDKDLGKYISQRREQRGITLKYRTKRFLTQALVPILAPPIRPLLDSHVPLPWPVYDAFFYYYAQSGRKHVAD